MIKQPYRYLHLMIKIFFMYIITNIFIFANAQNIGSETGFKIPRFISLKSNEVNLRIGSSLNYPIILQYTKKNLPLEIIEEYGVWRKIKDIKNNQGWIHKNLIKGDRFAIINQPYKKNVKIFSKPRGKIIGEIGKFNVIEIKTCLILWCKITIDNKIGWINKHNLWGVYKKEKINVSFFQPLINYYWKINL